MEWAMSRGLAVEGHRVTKFPTSKMHGYPVPPQPLIQCVPNIGNGPARAMLKNSTPPRRPPALKIPIEVERAECVPLCKMSRNESTIKVDHVRAVPVSFQLGRAENGDRQ